VTTGQTTAPRHTRTRRLAGFVAGLAAGWILQISGTYVGAGRLVVTECGTE
jgi:hypothetical protein